MGEKSYTEMHTLTQSAKLSPYSIHRINNIYILKDHEGLLPSQIHQKMNDSPNKI